MDVWGSLDERTPIRTPDGDALDLDRHVRARIHGSPAFGYVLQRSPILPLPVCATIPSRPDDLPECTLRDTIFPRPLPPLSLDRKSVV